MSWNKEEFFQNLRDLVYHLSYVFPSFWNYELFRVDKNPITIGNILIGLVFIIVGYISIRLITRYFEKRVLARLDIETPQKYTIKVFLFLFSSYSFISFHASPDSSASYGFCRDWNSRCSRCGFWSKKYFK